jgi:CTD small phosphatase-like protein 2
VKDLRIFEGLPLHEVVLIDNSVYSFAHQIENGVPIIPFYHDKNDEELLHLIFQLALLLVQVLHDCIVLLLLIVVDRL